MIKDALSAATPAMGMDATVVDWENNVPIPVCCGD